MSEEGDAGDVHAREPGGIWLRCRGVGRERLTRYLTEYFAELGYSAAASEVGLEGRNATRVTLSLSRPNPSVPTTLVRIVLRIVSTGGGCLVYWDAPKAAGDPARPDRPRRFVEEMVSALVRTVSTASRGTARVTVEKPGALPFGA